MSTSALSSRATDIVEPVAAHQSAVSWAAVFAGAVVATAATILLLTLGSGIGLSSVSPWQGAGATAGTIAVGAVIWLIVVQWVSSALGGYIAGRLRLHWTGLHTDEAFFRDTAHGLVAWSIATILTVIVVASAGSALLGAGARAVGGAASSAVQGASQAGSTMASMTDPSTALVDTLFRPSQPNAGGNAGDVKSEAGRILASSIATGTMTPADRTYLAQLAASRTGISQPDAEKRVDDAVAQVKAAADKARAAAEGARKAAAKLAFYTFFSMLIGAFVASVSAALGGRLRDNGLHAPVS